MVKGRRLAASLVFCLAVLAVIAISGEQAGFTSVAHASTDQLIKKLQEQIKQIEQSEREIKQERENLKEEINRLEVEKKEQEKALERINAEIRDTENKIGKKEKEVNATQAKVEQTKKELKAAEERVAQRKEELIIRLRSIYESGGSVSYLDVLMGASSVGDFLQRLDFLGYIMKKDRMILDAFIEEKERVEAKKKELESLLAQLNEQLTELKGLKSKLQAQKKDREVTIASIKAEQRHLAEYDEEKMQELLALANKKSALIRKKHEAELKKMEEERARRSPQASRGGAVYSGGLLAWPVPGYGINSPYGMRGGRMHYGVDMAAPRGTGVLAAEDGFVSTVVSGCQEGDRWCGGGFGNYVVITHPGGIDTLYAHLSAISVSEGQRVSRGQTIGAVGNTGNSTGPHLHFEVRHNGQRVNPTPYLR